VGAGVQRQLLKLLQQPLLQQPLPGRRDFPVEKHVVPLVLAPPTDTQPPALEAGAASAARTGASEMEDGALPPLKRVGPPGGLGPEDAFVLGMVLGPSGSGVTRLLGALARKSGQPEGHVAIFQSDKAVASSFSDAVSMLPRVGLNSVPAWMRPYHVLSNGQQHRVRLALSLSDGAIIDDFGNGIDEQEIRSVAYAIGKFVRCEGITRVLIGTHSADAVSFMQPDFVLWTTGEWSVNPNPVGQRRVEVRLEPLSMGTLTQPSDVRSGPDPGPYQYVDAVASGGVNLPWRTLEIVVQVDDRTVAAGNAFEYNFDGVARCEIPVLSREKLPADWLIGAVVGPSGTGKTTSLRNLYDKAMVGGESEGLGSFGSPDDDMTLFSHVAAATGCDNAAARALSACCVPSDCWFRVHSSLSNSEAWRARLAYRLAAAHGSARPETGIKSEVPVVIVDEFTTQLDRRHARALCEALRDHIQATRMRLLCATVHADVVAWLCPCWLFDTAQGTLTHTPTPCPGRSTLAPVTLPAGPKGADIWKPPQLVLDVQVVDPTSSHRLWDNVFKQHHYLLDSLHTSIHGGCFVVRERTTGKFAAFHTSNMLPGSLTCVREHRLVVCPEWQGFGIGPRLSNFLAARWVAAMREKGYLFSSKTAHPRLGELRQRDPLWRANITNLKPDNPERFGLIGNFDGTQEAESKRLVHGTRLRILGKTKEKFKVGATPPKVPDVELDFELEACAEADVERHLGITFQGESLVIVSIDGAALRLTSGTPVAPGWMVAKVSGVRVRRRAELREKLCRGSVVSLTFQAALRGGTGPERSCEEEAWVDVEWVERRCPAQKDLESELCHVRELLRQLELAAARQAQAVTPKARKSATGVPKSTNKPQRPVIRELPLVISPALSSAVEAFHRPEQKAERKARICYSHTYTGVPPEQGHGGLMCTTHDKYQGLMLLRVPELRSTGLTHHSAIEAARAEWSAGKYVVEVAWPEPGSLKSGLVDTLGLFGFSVGATGEILKLNTHGLLSGDRITAVRRGPHKVDTATGSDVLSALQTLENGEGETFWLYLTRAACSC